MPPMLRHLVFGLGALTVVLVAAGLLETPAVIFGVTMQAAAYWLLRPR